LVDFIAQSADTRERGFDVHVPERAQQFPQWLSFSFADPLAQLPGNVTHQKGNINRIVRCTLTKISDEPVFGLVVDQLVMVSDAGFAKTGVKRSLRTRHFAIVA